MLPSSRTMRLVVATGLALFSGCATSGNYGPDTRRGSPVDAGAPIDAPAPGFDAFVPPGTDAPPIDAFVPPGTDAPPIDAFVPPVDAFVPRDTPPSGPITCTAATAGTVCGGRPCVDGFCCDGPCTAACQACNLSGLQGVCSPEPMGTACDDGSAATTGDVCSASGTCAGTTPSCAMPTDACANGSQSRDRCANARIIGRTAAAAGFSISDSTCYAYNRFDTSCWDAGGDHAYRLFVRAGEAVVVTYSVDWSCPSYPSSFWDGTISIYEGTGCADYSCATQAICERYVSSSYTANYTAPRDGWITIVADGSTAFEDEGDYTLQVRLTCAAPGCGC